MINQCAFVPTLPTMPQSHNPSQSANSIMRTLGVQAMFHLQIHPRLWHSCLLIGFGILAQSSILRADQPPIIPLPSPVDVTIFEGLPAEWSGDVPQKKPDDAWQKLTMAFTQLPKKYAPKGAMIDRRSPFLLRSTLRRSYPAGTYELILRSRARSILKIDGQRVAETRTIEPNAGGHEDFPPLVIPADRRWKALETNSQERTIVWHNDGRQHDFELLSVIGDKGTRPETGELMVALVPRKGGDGLAHLLSSVGDDQQVELTDDAWTAFRLADESQVKELDRQRREKALAVENRYWQNRHTSARMYVSQNLKDLGDLTPTKLDRLMSASQPDRVFAKNVDDNTFLRRIYLDTVGVPPSPEEQLVFLNDPAPDRRQKIISKLLDDPRRADNWVGYWQDVLAENPGILKPTLNNTGPFRYFLYESFLDNLPMDRFVTQLIRMDGTVLGGSAGGFSMASQNDSPMAAKAHIIAKAFLASELKCARCHDAPKHPYAQSDLFELAALLAGKALTVPKTSAVVVAPGARVPAVSISLEPGDKIEPRWSLSDISPEPLPEELLPDNATSRDRLAALITWPGNSRFAKVMVNRVWAVRTGRPFVDPIDDWDVKSEKRFPEALEAMANDFMRHGYDLKRLENLIFNSSYYQAQPVAADAPSTAMGPARRSLTAEQLVDSLYAVAGKTFDCEELCLDPEGRRPAKEFINLGHPRRAWEMTAASNERDRPALGLPAATEITDLMQAFGWRSSRQDPLTIRETAVTPLQPGLLANGIVHTRISRMSDDSKFTDIALSAVSIDDLADRTIRRILNRPAGEQELAEAYDLFGKSFEGRLVKDAQIVRKPPRSHRLRVSWSNHLRPLATEIQLEEEAMVRAGDPATARLTKDFREAYEDWVWAMLNSPDFVFLP